MKTIEHFFPQLEQGPQSNVSNRLALAYLAAEQQATARQKALRQQGCKNVSMWSRCESIPIADSNCTETIRAWHVEYTD